MADKDDTSKMRPTRNDEGRDVSAATSTPVPTQLIQAIEAERHRLMQAHSVMHCLYEVLLYAEGDDAVTYAQAAHLAANLIDESVAQLDLVRLEPMIESLKQGSERKTHDYPLAEEKLKLGSGSGGDDEVREPRLIYRH